MNNFLRILLGLVLIGVVALLAIIFVPVQRSGPTTVLAKTWEPAPGAGLYAARMGDCAACHTAPGGEQFAGGQAIDSPMGTIFGSNITPDPETGIGGWSLDDFRAALVDGVAPDGTHLYPAMPYENYRHLTEEDIRALYDYFMNEVEPVSNQVPSTDLSFPFNQRWGIRLWNWVALDKPGFSPDAMLSNDEQLARGAYLVQGPGHCAACHSPRNLIMAQSGKTEASAAFLSGGEIDGWSAPDLRSADAPAQQWTAEQLKSYLIAGRNAHSSVAGEMGLVVAYSLQYMTDEDVDAMVAYLHDIRLGTSTTSEENVQGHVDMDALPDRISRLRAATDATSIKLATAVDLSLGERLYLDNCSACHFSDGNGSAGVFPALRGNSIVAADQTGGLINVILHGAAVPSTETRPEELKMPGFGHRLSDEDVAELTSFLRTAWGNDASVVSASDVAAHRN
ncbi:c-type cytochrome [Celeribacter sp.]|uniref:c-type cytochrome n=1 Tax=Celeribacter sp. TaxID=1890673 RepID=UPI003A91327E